MATFRAMTERALVLQPRSLAEVDAERGAPAPTLERRTARALEAVWGAPRCPDAAPLAASAPPPPPTATPRRAPPSARTATAGRRASRVRTIAAGVPRSARAATPAPPARPAPTGPLRFFNPDDPSPDWGASYRRGYDAWMHEKALRRAGRW
jgi:hypothetical protein